MYDINGRFTHNGPGRKERTGLNIIRTPEDQIAPEGVKLTAYSMRILRALEDGPVGERTLSRELRTDSDWSGYMNVIMQLVEDGWLDRDERGYLSLTKKAKEMLGPSKKDQLR